MSEKPSDKTGKVNIVVALSCEAKPLITFFRLTRASDQAGFVTYQNGQGITLIVTGAGKIAMAAACGYLAGTQISDRKLNSAWLNIGIAGHQNIALGKAMHVTKITDATTGQTFYPPLLLENNCEKTTLISVDRPENQYQDNVAYDMEGSAFYSIASRFVSSELVQIVKIVSDNRENSTAQITKSNIQKQVEDNLPILAGVVDQLQTLVYQYNSIYAVSDEYLMLLEKVHLTSSQQIQLSKLVSRFHALGGDGLDKRIIPENFKSAKNLINSLELLIEKI